MIISKQIRNTNFVNAKGSFLYRYKHFRTLAICKPEEIFPIIHSAKLQLPNGKTYFIRNKARYHTFSKNTNCCCCGLKGEIVIIQRDTSQEKNKNYKKVCIDNICMDKATINLYGIDQYGKLVLMTKDHIIPSSLGGKNNVNNSQTMCTNCNNKKQNRIILLEQLRMEMWEGRILPVLC
jgi:hypothetical protein